MRVREAKSRTSEINCRVRSEKHICDMPRGPQFSRRGAENPFLSRVTQNRRPKRPNSLFSLVHGLATTRQHRCDGNCEILVAAEAFGLTVDVTRNGGERGWFLRPDERRHSHCAG